MKERNESTHIELFPRKFHLDWTVGHRVLDEITRLVGDRAGYGVIWEMCESCSE